MRKKYRPRKILKFDSKYIKIRLKNRELKMSRLKEYRSNRFLEAIEMNKRIKINPES